MTILFELCCYLFGILFVMRGSDVIFGTHMMEHPVFAVSILGVIIIMLKLWTTAVVIYIYKARHEH